MGKIIDRFEVVSADGTRRRWVYVRDNSEVKLEGQGAAPSYWFEDTRGIAAGRDGQSFLDPTDDTRYTRV